MLPVNNKRTWFPKSSERWRPILADRTALCLTLRCGTQLSSTLDNRTELRLNSYGIPSHPDDGTALCATLRYDTIQYWTLLGRKISDKMASHPFGQDSPLLDRTRQGTTKRRDTTH